MSVSFSSFCAELGAPLHNKNWSWCAKASDNSFAVFTVWEDLIENGQFEFSWKPKLTDVRKKPGRKELIETLDLVLERGIPAYGIRCIAEDIDANPRKRIGFDTEALLDLRVVKIGDAYFGKVIGEVPPTVVIQRGANFAWISATAINDIDVGVASNSDPEYKRRMAGSYVRSQSVRNAVLKRAEGRCEECGELGFLKGDGSRFLETHHVISLSEQGPDKMHNVIALCPNDHRRAHFGKDWAQIQEIFLEKLAMYRVEDQ